MIGCILCFKTCGDCRERRSTNTNRCTRAEVERPSADGVHLRLPGAASRTPSLTLPNGSGGWGGDAATTRSGVWQSRETADVSTEGLCVNVKNDINNFKEDKKNSSFSDRC